LAGLGNDGVREPLKGTADQALFACVRLDFAILSSTVTHVGIGLGTHVGVGSAQRFAHLALSEPEAPKRSRGASRGIGGARARARDVRVAVRRTVGVRKLGPPEARGSTSKSPR